MMSGSRIAPCAVLVAAVSCVLFAVARARVEDPSGGGRAAGFASRQATAVPADARPAAVPAPDAAHDGHDHPPDTAAADGIHRALGMLEYVASDYDNAVGDGGVVLDPFEYEEQKQFMASVLDLLAQATPRASRGVRREVGSIRKSIVARHASALVVPRIRAVHVKIVREFNVRLTPQQVPSLAAGRILFEQACVACHGADGRAQTERARELRPRPVDFHSPDLDRRLSPYLAFSVVTFGVPGTAMAGFPALTEEERWDLAFFVCALRHEPPVRPAGATVAQMAGAAPVALTLADLARASDASLRALLTGMPPAARAAQLARWRWVPPLETGD